MLKINSYDIKFWGYITRLISNSSILGVIKFKALADFCNSCFCFKPDLLADGMFSV